MQVAPAILVVWFIFQSVKMSCIASREFATFTLIVLTLTCISHLAAVLHARKWNLMIYPVLMWVVCAILAGTAVH